jgi:acyl-CoA synthetase (AMP-forming)/AMP-acid ligase II
LPIDRHAARNPDKPAVIIAETGERLSYAELDDRSKRLAQLFRARGIGVGGHIAVLLDNHLRYAEVAWAAMRSGLYFTPINWHLGADEAGYIIRDCGAQALVTSAQFETLVSEMNDVVEALPVRLSIDGELAGFEPYEEVLAQQSPEPLPDETEGAWMFYSSGTTGRPKGILRPLSGAGFGEEEDGLVQLIRHVYGFAEDTRYLCPAPLYHAAPMGWTTSTHRIGGTAIVMERFDALAALRFIEQYKITEAQFVPTHFVRMLKLPEEERGRHDLSSLRAAVHAAAPCPVETKRRMIEWWGPKIYEYYAGSEGVGMCAIGSEDWLEHPGSVGRAVSGIVHIVGEEGEELPAGSTGQIWFETEARFEYHNDKAKTAEAWDERGWSTIGDVGYLDADGYLYLTDRLSHMIISGGVNIYPQEVEDALIVHPDVADAAVIGVPDSDMGEAVKAVVQLAPGVEATEDRAQALIDFCRERIAHFKCPRSVDFVEELPRLPTGKLLKRVLRDRYREAANS